MQAKYELGWALLACAVCAQRAAGQQVLSETELSAGDPSASDHLGLGVASDGDTIVAGASYDDELPLTDNGSAYVFVRSGGGWSEEQKLTPSVMETLVGFGHAVGLEGDTAVIGPFHGPEAFVFERQGTTWSEQAKLTGSGAYGFGHSVAVEGDRIVVGSRYEPVLDVGSPGSAFVFVRSGASWDLEEQLFAPVLADADTFGHSVAISGDTAVVGAPLDDHSDTVDAGSAYVFVRSGTTWSLQQMLTASDFAQGDDFGASVAISGDTVLIGADLDDHSGASNAGSAYVFVRNGTNWSEQQKLTGGSPETWEQFGYSVAVLGEVALIGAWGDNLPGLPYAGSAYLFLRSAATWSEAAQIVAGNAASSDRFGASVALAENTAAIGAFSRDQEALQDAGAVFAFELCPPPASYCTAGTSASGCQAILSASGTASASAAAGFSLMAAGVEGAKDGLFFFGANGGQANPWGNGTSYQCVVPPVSRAGLISGTGSPGLCDGAFEQDLNALWCPACPKPAKNPGAGAVVQAELWYRDPLSTSNQTTSLSDALEFCLAP